VPESLAAGPALLTATFDSGPLAGRLKAEATITIAKPQAAK
jgi:hypothetical protein